MDAYNQKYPCLSGCAGSTNSGFMDSPVYSLMIPVLLLLDMISSAGINTNKMNVPTNNPYATDIAIGIKN